MFLTSLYPKSSAEDVTIFLVLFFFRGDDDINDVAAMGGVNLAEETQRILGSTEFVGTTIRSCKDDIFLNAIPLQQRIKKIGKFVRKKINEAVKILCIESAVSVRPFLNSASAFLVCVVVRKMQLKLDPN